MIIKYLTLHNFGIYAGTNTFDFQEKKPVILIGGLNGRGKTTFLDAILLALYGSNSSAYVESRYKSYGQYLRSFVNKGDETLVASIELAFQLDAFDQENYLINREWNAFGQRTREKIKVYKDGVFNKFLTDNWSMFIENILPSGLSSFFFFDGEKIAKLAVEKTDLHMKESIKRLLGISVLDVLESDIKRIIAKSGVKEKMDFTFSELDKLQKAKDLAENNLDKIDMQISELEENIVTQNRQLEQLKDEYIMKGGDIVIQRQELMEQKRKYESIIAQDKEILLDLAASEMPLNLVPNLLKQVQEQVQKEHEGKTAQQAIDKLKLFYSKYKQSKHKESDAIRNFLDFVVEENNEEMVEDIFDISDSSRYLLDQLLSGQLGQCVKKSDRIVEHLEETYNHLEEVESYLSVDVNEKSVAKIYRKIRETEQSIIDAEIKLEAARKNRSTYNGNVIAANTDFNRFVEMVLQKMELNDDNERVFKYSQMAVNILEMYKIKLQSKKVNLVANTMTECYRKLANKRNLINSIHMDAKTLDFIYLDKEENEIPKESLSAGEKQLMVISLLWSLAICSRRKLPVIIDTPLSRLDSQHRVSVIKNYFPYASEQTIILSTDTEIDHYYYNILKEFVGDEFTLIYDDVNKSTTIHRGYFAEDHYDNQAN